MAYKVPISTADGGKYYARFKRNFLAHDAAVTLLFNNSLTYLLCGWPIMRQTGTVVCLQAAPRVQRSARMSCQSTATSETVKRCGSRLCLVKTASVPDPSFVVFHSQL